MRFILAAALLATAPATAQMPAAKPGVADVSRVTVGTYNVDPNHTQVLWTVDHMGLSPLTGLFPVSAGTLTIDPARPAAAKVAVTIDTAAITVTAPAFARHLSGADFFDVAQYPTASFTSTAVVVTGGKARITGTLTIKGVARPVVLDARFYGAGDNPMTKKANIGFDATTTIKRSDFKLGAYVPVVGDTVTIAIHAAFEKQ